MFRSVLMLALLVAGNAAMPQGGMGGQMPVAMFGPPQIQPHSPQAGSPLAHVTVENQKNYPPPNPCLPPGCCPPNEPECEKTKITVTTFANKSEPEPSFRNAFSNNSMTNNLNFLAKAGANLKFRLTELMNATSTISPPGVVPPGVLPPGVIEPTPYPVGPTPPPSTLPPELNGCWTQACWQANPCITRECVQARITFMASPAYRGIRRSPPADDVDVHGKVLNDAMELDMEDMFEHPNIHQLIAPESSGPPSNLTDFKGVLQSIVYSVHGREPPTSSQPPCIPPTDPACIQVNVQTGAANGAFGPGHPNKPGSVIGPDFQESFSHNGLTNNVNFYAEEGPSVDFGIGPSDPNMEPLIGGSVNINGEPDWLALLQSPDYQDVIAKLGLLGRSAKEQLIMLAESGASPQDIALALGEPFSSVSTFDEMEQTTGHPI